MSRPTRILDLWRLDELRGIALDGDAISLGALTTYTEIRRSALCREHLPVLVEAAATIGAAQIQNRGTLGGNVANASPAGDTLPVLLAADASFVLGSARGERTVAAAEFWPAYRQTALAPDELLLRIRIPLAGRSRAALPQGRDAPGPVDQQGRRRAAAGATARRGRAPWTDVRLALGSVAATPIRARATEAASRAGRRPPRRPIARPRRWPPSCTRSTTSARPPSTAGSWPRASSIA